MSSDDEMVACPHRKRVVVSSLEHGLAYTVGGEVANHLKAVAMPDVRELGV